MWINTTYKIYIKFYLIFVGRVITNHHLSSFYFVMHTNLVRVIIWTNKVLKIRGPLVMCTLTTLIMDNITQECSPKMCTANNTMPFFVTFTVIVHLQYYCIFWFLISSSQPTLRDTKPTQHIEITHPNNVNLNWRSTMWRPFTHTI